ncbi:substrate-binding domain-containing protein (plasmid) [Sinorhizobium meliloti]|uniref:substrate-binding domain-containing protein n=1 Tax=Sinorhizobium TaxID=28105 RepID=UPI0011A6E78E|nr:substrate-binding domain-containing protein [Sinorhizobium medicae]MDX0009839.1 substrate-binding domain-containing protein [Sinorhizobium meliloti]MDX0227309.1 substrate-binding domain-containing protein [Sinorhizobium meliloti]TWA26373.1 monosaccharide ABC transporter substrate-binding protein (CUT2 family) [Sinorhizobium medicae]
MRQAITVGVSIAALSLPLMSTASAQEGAAKLAASDFTTGTPDEIFARLDRLKEAAAAGQGKIAVLLPDTRSSARWATVDAPGFERAFQQMGLTPDDYIISNAQGSPQTQRTQAEQAITAGASILLITNLDSGSGAAIQADAASKGVVSIDYDRLTLNGSAQFYVSFDNKNVGERMAQGLEQCIADWKVDKPQIFHLGGSPTDNNATLVEQGYDEVLGRLYDAGTATRVGAVRVTNWDNQVGLTMFEQALQANPHINAALTANDGLGQAAISVLKNNGVAPFTFPTTGQDATLQGLQNVLTGYQCMTVYKPIYREAAAAAAVAVMVRAGQTLGAELVNGEYDAESHKVPSILLEPVSVTSKNMADTVVADGFVTAKDLCVNEVADACAKVGIR